MTAERTLVAWLSRLFATRRRDVVVGIGDDAAVVRPRGARLVMTCDPVVEGVHFASDAPAKLVGAKAVRRNLSDLAAMGAVPDHLLLSALLPRGLATSRRRALFAGVRAAADDAGCVVVGGDVAATPGPLVLTVTAVGHLTANSTLR